jgi:hypothetical protein
MDVTMASPSVNEFISMNAGEWIEGESRTETWLNDSYWASATRRTEKVLRKPRSVRL